MSLSQEERAAVVTYRLEKADRAFMQAKVSAMAKEALETV